MFLFWLKKINVSINIHLSRIQRRLFVGELVSSLFYFRKRRFMCMNRLFKCVCVCVSESSHWNELFRGESTLLIHSWLTAGTYHPAPNDIKSLSGFTIRPCCIMTHLSQHFQSDPSCSCVIPRRWCNKRLLFNGSSKNEDIQRQQKTTVADDFFFLNSRWIHS